MPETTQEVVEAVASNPRAIRGDLRGTRETRIATRSEFELREVPNGTGGTDLRFTGYASVTGAEYEMEDWLGPWTESMEPGAFKRVISENQDVSFLLNHEGMTLARTKSGTLKLAEDTTGLHTEALLDPKNMHVQAMRSAVERRDLDEMSFAFRVNRQEWNDDYTRRWIRDVNMEKGDVSLVNYGANPHTGGLVAIRRRTADSISARAVVAVLHELREGKRFSGDSLAVLQRALELCASADEALDEVQPMLADLIGVPNPDADDAAEDTTEVEQESLTPSNATATLSIWKAKLDLLKAS